MKLSQIYQYTYQKAAKNTENNTLIINLGGVYYKNFLPGASTLVIKETKKSLFLWNAGSTCKKLVKFIQNHNYHTVIIYGSKHSAYATIIWANLLNDFLSVHNKYCNFISIDPICDTDNLTTDVQVGIAPYINFQNFLSSRKSLSQGIIYLSKNTNTTIDLSSFKVIHTNYHKEDINYMLVKSVSASTNGINDVYKQFQSKNKPCNIAIAAQHLSNNFPSIITAFKGFYQNSSFVFDGDFSLETTKQQIVYPISNLNQFYNALYCDEINHNEARITIVVQYTSKNIFMPQKIYEEFLKIKQPVDLRILEIALSNDTSFKGYLYFYYKYVYLIKHLTPKILVINSLLHRTAILAHTATPFCPIYLIEEGTGTYLQYQKTQTESNKYLPLSFKQKHSEIALINSFGTDVMKKSLSGFLGFQKAYLALPNSLDTDINTLFYNPIQAYIQRHFSDIKKIQEKQIDNSTIYIDQIWTGSYIREYYELIFYILIQYCQAKTIYFCPHPRSEKNISLIEEIITDLSFDEKIKILQFEKPYKVELVIYALKPDSIYLINSSSSLYLQTICPNIKQYSIAELLIQGLKDNNFKNTKTIIEIEEYKNSLVKVYAMNKNKTKNQLCFL